MSRRQRFRRSAGYTDAHRDRTTPLALVASALSHTAGGGIGEMVCRMHALSASELATERKEPLSIGLLLASALARERVLDAALKYRFRY